MSMMSAGACVLSPAPLLRVFQRGAGAQGGHEPRPVQCSTQAAYVENVGCEWNQCQILKTNWNILTHRKHTNDTPANHTQTTLVFVNLSQKNISWKKPVLIIITRRKL